MKKLIIATLAVFILSHCEVRVQPTHAQQMEAWVSDANNHVNVYYSRKIVDSMEYLVVLTGASYGGAQAINLTKEKLEVEKLKLEIEKLKK